MFRNIIHIQKYACSTANHFLKVTIDFIHAHKFSLHNIGMNEQHLFLNSLRFSKAVPGIFFSLLRKEAFGIICLLRRNHSI